MENTKTAVGGEVIARLNASKQQAEGAQVEQGRQCGTEWGTKRASYPQLKAIAGLDLYQGYVEPLSVVVGRTLDPDYPAHEFWENEVDDAEPEDAFVWGFVEAAADVFASVEPVI